MRDRLVFFNDTKARPLILCCSPDSVKLLKQSLKWVFDLGGQDTKTYLAVAPRASVLRWG